MRLEVAKRWKPEIGNRPADVAEGWCRYDDQRRGRCGEYGAVGEESDDALMVFVPRVVMNVFVEGRAARQCAARRDQKAKQDGCEAIRQTELVNDVAPRLHSARITVPAATTNKTNQPPTLEFICKSTASVGGQCEVEGV